jgi:hypothetical protein
VFWGRALFHGSTVLFWIALVLNTVQCRENFKLKLYRKYFYESKSNWKILVGENFPLSHPSTSPLTPSPLSPLLSFAGPLISWLNNPDWNFEMQISPVSRMSRREKGEEGKMKKEKYRHIFFFTERLKLLLIYLI